MIKKYKPLWFTRTKTCGIIATDVGDIVLGKKDCASFLNAIYPLVAEQVKALSYIPLPKRVKRSPRGGKARSRKQ